MKTKRALLTGLAIAFLLGAAIPALVVWNPAQWGWADHLVHRVRNPLGKTGSEGEKQLWTCGMHPQVIQDEPGDCPICGMKLTPVSEPSGAAAGGSGGERKIKYWRAPMDPNYISDKPGKSPMGMDLIPVYEDEAPAATGVHVDPNFVQNFAIRTATAEKGSIPIETRTLGTLAYNEKNIVSVNTKFEGWIEKAYVNYIGEPVRRGQVLFEIYSPQLVTTQQEYLSAAKYVSKLTDGGSPDAVTRARSLLGAARERLRYWDITDEQIDSLLRKGKSNRTLKIVSPVSGVVTEKMAESLEGMKLAPGMNVYRIADLSTLWVDIQVFESQIKFLRLGQPARITVDAFPGRIWTGKIIYLDPEMNQKTRTLKAFVEIPNGDRTLRPEMFANVELRIPAVLQAVRIPEEAVLHSGQRNVVIVRKDKATFEPREIQLGATGGGFQEVRAGLEPGEVVVTSSQFLIDSESNLKEAIQKMLASRKSEGGQTEDTGTPQHVH